MESAKDTGKNLSNAREAIERIKTHCLSSPSIKMGSEYGFGPDYVMDHDCYEDETMTLEVLVIRDEPKHVNHENVMKQFGKCPVCNSSVTIQFHSDFCGKCGNRLVWEGERK